MRNPVEGLEADLAVEVLVVAGVDEAAGAGLPEVVVAPT